jgi:hypothetical protein
MAPKLSFAVTTLLATNPDNLGTRTVPLITTEPPEGMVMNAEEALVGVTSVDVASTFIFLITGVALKVTFAPLIIEIVPKLFVVEDDIVTPSYSTSKLASKMLPKEIAVVFLYTTF